MRILQSPLVAALALSLTALPLLTVASTQSSVKAFVVAAQQNGQQT